MDLDDTIDTGHSNHSDNRTFDDVLAARLTRRTVMAGGLATAAATFFGASSAFASRPVDVRTSSLPRGGRDGRGIGFTSIPLQNSAWPTIAPEYQWSVLIPWREKLDGSGTSFDYGLTADQQAASIGIGHDGMWYFGSDKRGMLCINHEFGTAPHLIGKAAPTSLDDVRLMQHAHGVSVVKIERSDDDGPSGWRLKGDKRNRRIHVNTPVVFSGPAAASPLLQTAAGNPTLGTLNNCANGYTPWGTYLTCEENFNGYFGRTVAGTNTPETGPLRLLGQRLRLRLAPVRPPLRPVERRVRQRGEPLRVGRRDRPERPEQRPREAHGARPREARGRHVRRGQGRSRRRLHG